LSSRGPGVVGLGLPGAVVRRAIGAGRRVGSISAAGALPARDHRVEGVGECDVEETAAGLAVLVAAVEERFGQAVEYPHLAGPSVDEFASEQQVDVGPVGVAVDGHDVAEVRKAGALLKIGHHVADSFGVGKVACDLYLVRLGEFFLA
jgi:hypothetical protein